MGQAYDFEFKTNPFINGQWVEGDPEQIIENINPASGQTVVRVLGANKAHANAAVTAALASFPSWSRTTPATRAGILRRFSRLIGERSEELSRKSSLINGKPIRESQLDVEDAQSTFEFYADLIEQDSTHLQQKSPISVPGFESVSQFEPVGVVAAITPWNFPLVTSAWKIAPALAAGCSVVLKPSEDVSAVELELGDISIDAGLPSGVLNILPGDGPTIGAQLSMHPGVDKVSFTGGNAVGAEVMRLAALSAKNVTLELGGKSSIIVFDDADLETAVDAIMAGIFFNCGQMCSATSRLVIHQDVGEAVKQVLLDRVAKLKIVGSDDLASDMGPITTRRQFDKVCAYFSTASKENLHVLHGGRSLEADGFFVEPTIYWDVPTSSRLWREEIFGPVLCVRTFDSEQEAISIAEDTEYGLAATLCGQDTERLARVSNKLRAGHIWWNAEQFVPVESSWGGFKSSGIGRELGLHGLRSFQEVKQITRPIKRASTSIA